MTATHPILAEFQQHCHQHFICYALAVGSLNNFVSDLGNGPPASLAFFNEDNQHQRSLAARMTIDDLRQLGVPEGLFSDILAKAILVSLYAGWDEHFRVLIARSIGAKKATVRCNLMGDLRLIRNCIIHAQSIVTNEHEKCTELPWLKDAGHLTISLKMMIDFFSRASRMQISFSQ